MGACPHRGSGSPQIFRDVRERGIRDDAVPKSLVFVCSPCLPVVYSSRCDISGHPRFRALDAAVLSFLASALAARLPLIGSSISFCPAAALRRLLPFAGSDPRSFAMLRVSASIRSTTFSLFGRALAAMGLPVCFSRNSSRRLCSTRAGAQSAGTKGSGRLGHGMESDDVSVGIGN
jgi:hypothetical protein